MIQINPKPALFESGHIHLHTQAIHHTIKALSESVFIVKFFLALALPYKVKLAALCLLLAACSSYARDYSVLASYPHYSRGFTQGLELYKDRLYESSGQYGRSFVLFGNLTGTLKKRSLPDELFAEGLTIFQNRLYLLTWRNGEALVLDPETLEQTARFRYSGEGWGLTHSDTELYMSDGSDRLRVLDPDTFEEKRRISVHYKDQPVQHINELEWYDGLILANQWQSERILVIDAAGGEVLKILDLSELFPRALRGKGTDVFNGIAYDPASDSWLVTGKYWPRIYRLSLALPAPPDVAATAP